MYVSMGYSIWDQVCLIQLQKTRCCYLPVISSKALNKNIVSASPSQPYLLRGERSASVPVLTPGQQHLFVLGGMRTVPLLGSFAEERSLCAALSKAAALTGHICQKHIVDIFLCRLFRSSAVFQCLLTPPACSRSWCVTQGAVLGMYCCHCQYGNLTFLYLEGIDG